jgi:hypothetical protein
LHEFALQGVGHHVDNPLRQLSICIPKEILMAKVEDDFAPLKSDDAKGDNSGHTRLEKEADEAAKRASKTQQNYDKKTPIFTK